jgi:lipopolysaccharide transport system ATP-binding protein
MSKPVIEIQRVGKRYRIGAKRERYLCLREEMAKWFRRIARRSRSAEQHFWALDDVSFSVQPGETLGIIGRNGAGKSTLLKILSQITPPTKGTITVRGRVGSMLEVGTGFHPELTGRENIYMNGAILGMSRREIARKFDEIVAFAEMEKFLETPVKHYSSGMYVRLAFSVAAHLEPEILVVDEVLSVGDAQFQKKCLGKMGDVAKTGRTVLFVSHNMSQIARLCQTCVLLDQGRIRKIGDVASVTSEYLKSDSGHRGERIWNELSTAPGDGVARLRAVRVIADGTVTDLVNQEAPVTIEMEFWNRVEGAELLAAFSFINSQGVVAFVSADFFEPRWGCRPRPAGLHRVHCTVPGGLFNEGLYSVVAEVSTRTPTHEIHFLEHDSAAFQVVDSDHQGSLRSVWARDIPGVVRPRQVWDNWESDYLGVDTQAASRPLAKAS